MAENQGTGSESRPYLVWNFRADAAGARAQSNLIPNPDFNDPVNPLKGWRIDFPDQGTYAQKNAGYYKISTDKKMGSANVVEVSIPGPVAENEGAKIESAFVPAKGGGTYKISVQCLTEDLSVKVYCDGYAIDPTPPGAPNMDRVLAHDGMPALVRFYRGQCLEIPAESKTWATAQKEFKLPEKVMVAGQPEAPSYLAIRVFAYSAHTGTKSPAKSYYTHFQLSLIK